MSKHSNILSRELEDKLIEDEPQSPRYTERPVDAFYRIYPWVCNTHKDYMKFAEDYAEYRRSGLIEGSEL